MKNRRGRNSPSTDTPGQIPVPWNEWFRKFAHRTSESVGCPWAFFTAMLLIAIWAALGPIFDFSDTWQLVINTGTTIITFLMVFLIQNTQNRDAKAIHLKLDELIHHIKGARNSLIKLEELSDDELARLQKQFERLRQRANGELQQTSTNSSSEDT
jgi:low affinity Fe/Cu permease